jgi:hypothetical protein
MAAESSTTDREALSGFAVANATLIVWVVFLGFGSAFLAFYYSHIHYFPELEWETALSYLAATSVLGGGAVAIYGLLLFVPGWMWSEFLIFDAELVTKDALCYSVGFGEKPPLREPCFWRIGRRLVVPFALMMSVIHVPLYTGDTRLLFATALASVSVLGWHSYVQFSRDFRDKPPRETSADSKSFVAKYVATTAIAALSGITSLVILSQLIDPGSESGRLLTICTVGVVVTNLLVAVQYRQRPTRAVVTSIVAALALMISGEVFATRGLSQSERLMNEFGIGETTRVRLDLTADGAARLRQDGLEADDLAPSPVSARNTSSPVPGAKPRSVTSP